MLQADAELQAVIAASAAAGANPATAAIHCQPAPLAGPATPSDLLLALQQAPAYLAAAGSSGATWPYCSPLPHQGSAEACWGWAPGAYQAVWSQPQLPFLPDWPAQADPVATLAATNPFLLHLMLATLTAHP
jgi:hypothetical protein